MRCEANCKCSLRTQGAQRGYASFREHPQTLPMVVFPLLDHLQQGAGWGASDHADSAFLLFIVMIFSNSFRNRARSLLCVSASPTLPNPVLSPQ